MSERYYKKQYLQDKTLLLTVTDLLSTSVDAIVNPANAGLSHGGGLAAVISREAGPSLDSACAKIIEKIGRIPMTYAVPTKAYDLPFKGIIHAIGPRMGDGDEKSKEEKTILNCLKVAESKNWKSVAFPALGTGIFMIPKKLCAEAFRSAIDCYWRSYPDSIVDTIWLCLTLDDFPIFKMTMEESDV